MRKFAILALLFLSTNLFAHVILKVEKISSQELAHLLQNHGLTGRYKILSRTMGLVLAEVPLVRSQTEILKIKNELAKSKFIKYSLLDQTVKRRDYRNGINEQQWSLGPVSQYGRYSTNAAMAWEYFGVGGKDAYDSDIVVAVVDEGVDYTHPLLQQNLWHNIDEIPGNGIDDDGNGYIDDVIGWNAANNNGKIIPGNHGTHVAGIIGAFEQDGLVGVNWNVKIMSVDTTNSSDSFNAGQSFISTVISAYSYVLEQKLRWQSSRGKFGANIVTTNSSFGVDRADCSSEEYKLWNDLYDQMGKAGILSAVATSNSDYDVDEGFDVPSACASNYIIAVGNIGRTGMPDGAWGRANVDIYAQGTNILSTVTHNKKAVYSGTSMATPHVSGAIAYLHSVGGEKFARYHRESPDKAALFLKEILLRSSQKDGTLIKRSASGGYLNIYNAARVMKKLSNQ